MNKRIRKAITEFMLLTISGGMTGIIFAIWFLLH